MFALIVGGIVWRASRTSTTPSAFRDDESRHTAVSSAPKDHSQSELHETPPETPDESRRRLLPGVWQDEYQGKRTMTLNEDGTGTMLVELTGVQASLFASRLRFDMEWSVVGDKLIKTTTGGEPAKTVNLILKMMGDSAEDTILEISDERLRLLDKDGKTEYDWKRVPRDESNSDSKANERLR